MASEYTENYQLDLYTDADKPNLRDQYNAAMRKIDAQMAKPVASDHIADQAVTSGKIGDLAVTTPKLADDAVTAPKLANGAVTSAKLAPNAAISNITDGTLDGSTKLVVTSVTTGKLANKSVTSAKLANKSVSTSKLANKSVTTDKLADKSVTADKLADKSVTADKLADKSVTADKLADGVLNTTFERVTKPVTAAITSITNLHIDVIPTNAYYGKSSDGSTWITAVQNEIRLINQSDSDNINLPLSRTQIVNNGTNHNLPVIVQVPKSVNLNADSDIYVGYIDSFGYLDIIGITALTIYAESSVTLSIIPGVMLHNIPTA